MQHVLTIGHRGACGEAPENTMASFRLGLEQGVDMMELDVRLCRDGVPVVIHDYKLDRTTDGRGLVSRNSWARISQLDAGGWFAPRFAGERLVDLRSCLEELLPLVPINVEIKSFYGPYQGLCDAVADVIRGLGKPGRVLVTSFRHRALDYLSNLSPDVPTGRLFHPLLTGPVVRARDLEWVQRAPRRHPGPGEVPWPGRAVVVDRAMATRDLVEEVRARGGVLLTYTINEPEDMKRVVEAGVDGVITNFPARFNALIGRSRPAASRS